MVDEDGTQLAFGFTQDVLKRFFHMLFGVGESDDPDGGGLPDILEIEFGDGDVELAAEAVFEAADDLALVLERMRVGEAEFESEQANGHLNEVQRTRVQSTRASASRISETCSAHAEANFNDGRRTGLPRLLRR